MAIDQVEKRRTIARELTQTGAVLMDTLYRLDALTHRRDHGNPGGTPLVFAETDFTSQPGLSHVDVAVINACFAAIPTILTAFAAQNFDDVFEAVRP